MQALQLSTSIRIQEMVIKIIVSLMRLLIDNRSGSGIILDPLDREIGNASIQMEHFQQDPRNGNKIVNNLIRMY